MKHSLVQKLRCHHRAWLFIQPLEASLWALFSDGLARWLQQIQASSLYWPRFSENQNQNQEGYLPTYLYTHIHIYLFIYLSIYPFETLKRELILLLLDSVGLFASFFLNLIKLFLAVLGLLCCARAFFSCGEQGLLFVAVRGLLIVVASLVEDHGF